MADPSAAPPFTGFPPEAVDFYRRLGADNTKAFWEANRDTYLHAVKEPLTALTAELSEEFGPFRLFRPHRDVRFSRDKSPYKTGQGGMTEGEGGEVYYLYLDADGLLVATGYHQMAKDQLERYLRAVDDEVSGEELVRLVTSIESDYEIGGSALRTAPRGYPRDHERIRFLRHKGLTAARSLGAPRWLGTRATVTRVADTWRGAAPLNAWLNQHVGPSTILPDELR